jgi:hypothetical protein
MPAPLPIRTDRGAAGLRRPARRASPRASFAPASYSLRSLSPWLFAQGFGEPRP